MIKNKLGGVNDTDSKALERAKKSDLVTLPEDVDGTNCYNCKWISQHRRENYSFCTHPSIRQNVNGRMCCVLWDAKGVYRPYKQDERFK